MNSDTNTSEMKEQLQKQEKQLLKQEEQIQQLTSMVEQQIQDLQTQRQQIGRVHEAVYQLMERVFDQTTEMATIINQYNVMKFGKYCENRILHDEYDDGTKEYHQRHLLEQQLKKELNEQERGNLLMNYYCMLHNFNHSGETDLFVISEDEYEEDEEEDEEEEEEEDHDCNSMPSLVSISNSEDDEHEEEDENEHEDEEEEEDEDDDCNSMPSLVSISSCEKNEDHYEDALSCSTHSSMPSLINYYEGDDYEIPIIPDDEYESSSQSLNVDENLPNDDLPLPIYSGLDKNANAAIIACQEMDR
jgi:hypothetical protein